MRRWRRRAWRRAKTSSSSFLRRKEGGVNGARARVVCYSRKRKLEEDCGVVVLWGFCGFEERSGGGFLLDWEHQEGDEKNRRGRAAGRSEEVPLCTSREPLRPLKSGLCFRFSARTKGLVTFKMSLKCCFCSSFEREVWERPTGVGARFFFSANGYRRRCFRCSRTGWVCL